MIDANKNLDILKEVLKTPPDQLNKNLHDRLFQTIYFYIMHLSLIFKIDNKIASLDDIERYNDFIQKHETLISAALLQDKIQSGINSKIEPYEIAFRAALQITKQLKEIFENTNSLDDTILKQTINDATKNKEFTLELSDKAKSKVTMKIIPWSLQAPTNYKPTLSSYVNLISKLAIPLMQLTANELKNSEKFSKIERHAFFTAWGNAANFILEPMYQSTYTDY